MVNVYYSRVMAAPAERVWSVVSDFGSLPRWFPFVTSSILHPADRERQVGVERTNAINDGTVVVERLVELSDRDCRVSYDVVGGDAPVENYNATITVYDVSDTETSFVTWTATFDTIGEVAEVAEWVRNTIFRDCLTELDKILTKSAH